MRRLLFPLILLLSGAALAQDTSAVSYDPSVLAASFFKGAALVLVAVQFIKQHIVKALKKDPPKWMAISLSFLLGHVLAYVLQFGLGGITDPNLAALDAHRIAQAETYAVLTSLVASGFHGFVSGVAKNVGKAVASCLTAMQKKEVKKNAE